MPARNEEKQGLEVLLKRALRIFDTKLSTVCGVPRPYNLSKLREHPTRSNFEYASETLIHEAACSGRTGNEAREG